jgi:hypothetical protein
VADEVARDVFWLSQVALLADDYALASIPAAIRKIQAAWR